jgi:glucose/arabinose dehydrogenase
MRSKLILVLSLLPFQAAAQSPVVIELVEWAQGFFNPTDITHAGDDRLFVAQQTGLVMIVTDSNVVLPVPFLDISTRVIFSAEQGLLGLTFDPDYANNGYFYVHYVADDSLGHRSVVSRFSVSNGDPDVADPLSEVVLYTWPQNTDQHKGGDLAFAPDGTLFITFGDGSLGGDPNNVAQDLSDPLGSILRIRPEPGGTYSIPPDNPFVGAGGDTLPEIWAYGLRNPFRIAVDPEGGALWIGDVGQSSYEEVNRWPLNDNSGPNFGWRCREGLIAFDTTLCAANTPFVDPIAVEANYLIGGNWCAVASGRVYRGSLFPRLLGRYLFVDYCSGQVRTLRPDGMGSWIEEVILQSGPVGLVAIDEDVNGELFAISNFVHKVYRIVDPCPVLPDIVVSGDTLITAPGNDHQWYLDGVLITSGTDASIVPAVTGNYWVLVDVGNGCVLSSDTVHVVVLGVQVKDPVPVVQLHPNPTTEHCTLTWDAARWGDLSVEALDATGRKVSAWNCSSGSCELDLGDLAPGCFSIRVETLAGVVTRHVLVVQ